MKQMLRFCIVAVFAVCASGARAVAATSACADMGLADGERKYIECNYAGLAYADTCVAYCDDGKIVYGIERCRAGFFKLKPYIKNSDLCARCGTEKDACEAAGLRWNDSRGRGKCDCGGYDYEWNKTTMRCEESEDYKACNTNTNAHWDYNLGMCICNDTLQYQWDDVQHECIKLPDQAECETFQSNSQFEGTVKWNPVTRVCECVKDKAGTAITKPGDWRIGTFGCEKKPSALRREEFVANKPAADKVSTEITDIIKELNGISDSMGRSRWKNAEGKFNTSRLASDSIAGVVLGTVGGVITSNVIKKNQVSNGLEDINCTVGGQRVADYGDQFRVGIK